jgi:hypothetical protein
MKILNKLKPSNWGLIKVIRDLNNYSDWIKTVKKEAANKNSKYNKWSLQHNSFYTLYAIMSLDEADYALPENIKRLRVLEMTTNLNKYLDEDLGFAECLTPEFLNFHDENNKPTLSYIVAYRFSFNKLSLWWLIKWSVLISVLIYCLIKYDLISKLYGWLIST